jgi:uncharacterized protein YsxB (DUF464 family)
MIRVDIRRNVDRSINGFTVSGHADFDIPGKDIVCSGVSAVTIGTVNAIEALLGLDVNPQVKRGYINVNSCKAKDDDQHRMLQLLLESMVVMLQGIESSYGSYVKLQETIQ